MVPSVQFGHVIISYHAYAHDIVYVVSAHAVSRNKRGSLVDRGANGGILGSDARVTLVHTRTVDVTGIDNHELNALKMVDASARITTQKGSAIAIFRQYAYHGQGRTIHSAGQFEHYKNKVDDRSMKNGGRQCIRTNDGYIIPLDIINGLPYMKMQPNTDKEFEELPHVILTSGEEWNPVVIDHTLSDRDDWYNTLKEWDDGLIQTPFDEYGNYRHRQPVVHVTEDPPIIPNDDPVEGHNIQSDASESTSGSDTEPTDEDEELDLRVAFHEASDLNQRYICFDHDIGFDEGDNAEVELAPVAEVKKKPPDYEKYRPYFLHVPKEKIRQTFKRTTQFASNVMAGRNVLQTIKSPYPANNVWRRNEPVASDTIFADVPAVDTGGQKAAQLYIGRVSLVSDAYGMSSTEQFVNTLEDVIRKRGAMDKLITDSARVEISKRVADILRALCIDDWQSEANYQSQNFAEHRWKHIKRNVNFFMNWRNVPPNAWLLCLQWVCDVMNHTAEKSIGWRPPLQVLTGQTVDISILLCFLFWDVVYFPRYDGQHYHGQIGSQKSSEIRGRFVGFSWDVGHALTFKVLTDDTKKVMSRSRMRLAQDGENNLKLDVEAGAVPQRIYIRSKRDSESGDVVLPTIDMTKCPFTADDEPADPGKKGEPDYKDGQPATKKGEPTVEQGEPVSTELGEQAEGNDKGQPSATGEHTVTPQDAGEHTDTPDDLDDRDPEYQSPMAGPSLRDMPLVETLNEDDDNVADHVRDPRKPGDPNPDQDPMKFTVDRLDTVNPTVPDVAPDDMQGRTFLMPPREDGTRHRARIVKMIADHKKDLEHHPELIKFKCLVNNDYEEVVAYNDIVDFIEQDESWDGIWKFEEILDHQGPLTPSDPRYKGSRWNTLVRWDTQEKTWEPLTTKDKAGIYDSDPVTVAIYARKHNLLDTKGWKLPLIKKYAKTQQRILRLANQAKLHSFRHKPIYMYGFQVPRNYQQALDLDKANGNSKWQDAIEKELTQVDEYETFHDQGTGSYPGKAYKRINVHLVFAVKHDGRHKARLVAGGHLTETPIDSVYSSVVSLRGIRMLTFLAELNGLETWCTDIGNAYLESLTQEKVYIVAGPEFGDREGHTLLIVKALYGLKSSGLRWHERFADVLRSIGFFPSRAEPDIWMRDKGDHYEYIGVYVDDLLIASKDPQSIIATLTDVYLFKLKGTGPIAFHLGCDFFRDADGNLCYAPRKYIERMLDNYKRIFGKNPRLAQSPLIKGDHPELDTSDLLDDEWVKIYQSLIGALQWVIQIGRWDISTAVMTLSRFRCAPRQGHLDRIKRIHGYLLKMKHGIIRIRTEVPDYSDIPEKVYDWFHTCYRGASEEIPDDLPRPLGQGVQTTSWVDANLYHDLISGKAVTGILHMFNKTPIDTFSKLQATVETATFGSEYVAARTCTEQIIDLRNTLRYLGVPVLGASMMFGDNETVVNTASIPHSRLHKRHNALSYHKTRSSIAAGILRFYHVMGKLNPADILSKHWDLPSVWPTLKPIMFWRGDTADLDESAKGKTVTWKDMTESGKDVLGTEKGMTEMGDNETDTGG